MNMKLILGILSFVILITMLTVAPSHTKITECRDNNNHVIIDVDCEKIVYDNQLLVCITVFPLTIFGTIQLFSGLEQYINKDIYEDD